jgi:hypothetical protein
VRVHARCGVVFQMIRTVIAHVELPDMQRGVRSDVEDTARVRGLAARSLVSYVEVEPVRVYPVKVADVLRWVDSDPRRARFARAKELMQERPRSTLIAGLDKVIEYGVRQDGGDDPDR